MVATILTPTMIHVDRSKRPALSRGVKEWVHPELQQTGPTSYDLATDVELWFHTSQVYFSGNVGRSTGAHIHKHLVDTGMIELCLGLEDARAIQKIGGAAFRRLIPGGELFFWKSVGRFAFYQQVPYLLEVDGEILQEWSSLHHDNFYHPAARFRPVS